MDVSLFEILVVLIVALLVLKPEDLPDIARQCARVIKKIRAFWMEQKQFVHNVTQEFTEASGLTDIKQELDIKIGTIKDAEGQLRQTYHIPGIVMGDVPLPSTTPKPDDATPL